MATLPILVSAVAAVDGRDRATIEHTARIIREAGFIATGKRGGGAAEMDFAAAANLLIGLNAADAPKDAPAAIAFIRQLKKRRMANETGWPILDEVAAAETFGEALERFLSGAAELFDVAAALLVTAYGEGHLRQVAVGLGPISFAIEIGRSSARLALESPGLEKKVQWAEEYTADAFDPAYHQRAGFDRHVTVSVGAPTIIKIYTTITGERIECLAEAMA